ncbi:MAG: glycerol-3-phosphate 1-O-acyltransferase PlsY [Candidatus Aminicenantes bacterium]|nr:glycerol-3-phosphate 1-O-acyltransferase PlsY [Candidatus Aminicenantes bacterium]
MKILLPVLSYLLGAFPTGYLLVKWTSQKDIRRLGSGATGATNVLRQRGWRAALPVVLIDLAKGALPALAGYWISGGDSGFAALCGSLAVLGHCYPVYIGFRGGKGVATAAGAMFALAPGPAALCLGVFLIIVAVTRYVSLGSISAAVLFPVFGFFLRLHRPLLFGSLLLVAVILVRHRSNIARLLSGKERKLGQKDVPS